MLAQARIVALSHTIPQSKAPDLAPKSPPPRAPLPPSPTRLLQHHSQADDCAEHCPQRIHLNQLCGGGKREQSLDSRGGRGHTCSTRLVQLCSAAYLLMQFRPSKGRRGPSTTAASRTVPRSAIQRLCGVGTWTCADGPAQQARPSSSRRTRNSPPYCWLWA